MTDCNIKSSFYMIGLNSPIVLNRIVKMQHLSRRTRKISQHFRWNRACEHYFINSSTGRRALLSAICIYVIPYGIEILIFAEITQFEIHLKASLSIEINVKLRIQKNTFNYFPWRLIKLFILIFIIRVNLTLEKNVKHYKNVKYYHVNVFLFSSRLKSLIVLFCLYNIFT